MSNECSSESCGGTCGTNQQSNAEMERNAQDIVINASLAKIKNKIFVMSGKGGVGKSTVAVNLALGLAEANFQVGLMDVDLHGPSVPKMLGISGMLDLSPDKRYMLPKKYNSHLRAVSIECLMQDTDSPVIWRGPLKMGAIRQFVSDVMWDDLDYLVIDSPPGTGDEPLAIAEIIKDAKAVIVTQPQEISLSDVRKSINFCSRVNMDVLGLIENMSGYVCPKCGERLDLFKSGGGEKMAAKFKIPFLGTIPIDPRVVEGGDNGVPFMAGDLKAPAAESFQKIIKKIIKVKQA